MKRRHPRHNSMVPAVGLAKGELLVAAYDCSTDVLLVVHPAMEWFSMATQTYDIGGLVVLWGLLHHWLFLRETVCAAFPGNFACTLKEQFTLNKSLEHYESLNTYGVSSWARALSRPKKRPWSPGEASSIPLAPEKDP